MPRQSEHRAHSALIEQARQRSYKQVRAQRRAADRRRHLITILLCSLFAILLAVVSCLAFASLIAKLCELLR